MTRRVCVIISVLVLSLATSVHGESSGTLSDQKTTSRHGAKSPQWISESVTVLSARDLNQTYNRDLEALEGDAPGFLIDAMSTTPRGAAMAMRGVSSNESSNLFFPAIAVNVDGVYVGTHASQNQTIFDIEQMEIFRGPQGLFQGPPASAGAVNIYRSRPTGEPSVAGSLSFGDYGRRRVNGVVNFPLLNQLAGKVTLDMTDGGGKYIFGRRYVSNAFSSRAENEEQRKATSVALRWHGTDLQIQYTFDAVNDTSDVPALLNLSSAADVLCDPIDPVHCSAGTNGLIPETGNTEFTLQNFANDRKYETRQHAVHVDLAWLGHDIRSISAYRQTSETSNQDLDATSIDFYSTVNHRDYEQLSQEVTAFSQLTPDIAYQMGGYILSTQSDLDRQDHFVIGAIANAGRILPVPAGEIRTVNADVKTRLQSLFGHIEYQMDPQWTVDGGMCWNVVRLNWTHLVSRPNNGLNALPVLVAGSDDHREITGTVGVTYKVDEEAMVYFRYNRAWRPGGYDDNANSTHAAAPFDAERVNGYEIGLKSEWWDDTLRLNYAFFENILGNRLERSTQVVASGQVESILKNVSKTKTTGHEFELESVAVENLVIRAALSFMRADYSRYFVPSLIDPTSQVSFADLAVPLAPVKMFKLTGLYTLPYGDGHFRFYGGYRFTTEYWSNPTVPAGRVHNFAMIDLSADYLRNDWTFRLFLRNHNDIRNLTNVRSPTDAELVSLPPGITAPLHLLTVAEPSQPKVLGLEIIFTP